MYQRFTADTPEEGVGMTSTVDPPKKRYLDEPAANISPAVVNRNAHSHIFCFSWDWSHSDAACRERTATRDKLSARQDESLSAVSVWAAPAIYPASPPPFTICLAPSHLYDTRSLFIPAPIHYPCRPNPSISLPQGLRPPPRSACHRWCHLSGLPGNIMRDVWSNGSSQKILMRSQSHIKQGVWGDEQ